MHSNTGVLWMIRCCSIGMAGFLLVGCSASQYAPVQELGYSTAEISVSGGVQSTLAPYRVKPGDTMFAIAWRFGWDYKKLAKSNGIDSPYTIYVGQVIYFNDINSNYLVSQSASKISLKNPVIGAKTIINQPSSSAKKSPAVSIVPKKSSKIPKQKPYIGPTSIKWVWPLRGEVLQKFSSKGNAFHGIDVASSLGKSVKAASSGIIVYAGSGIQGYGKLVVVKHNNTFLSAYAYNSRILVVEGATVNAGQIIAEVGKGPQLDPRLHFEIRKDGKPVNPLRYLPKL